MNSKPRARTAKQRSQEATRRIGDWFAGQGWKPFSFQRAAWLAFQEGKSGLIHATTGTGKTYAAWMGPLLEWMSQKDAEPAAPIKRAVPLRVLWITPLRALAADTLQALQKPLRDLQIPWTVEGRTSDTSSSVRNRQRKNLPTVLVTTPESMSLLLTDPSAQEKFAQLQTVIVDEWHELLSTKRGVQVELSLARLRRWRPRLRTWGLSATLGNTDQAMQVLLGSHRSDNKGILIEGMRKKRIRVDSIIPTAMERFPWAGHLGLKLLSEVVKSIEASESSLVFTNTRSQTEAWYQALLKSRPHWAGRIALHHGSLDRSKREWVEHQLRAGNLKCVVCTSTLDLGVDFSPVERIFQVGSPKGIARLLQRAGRSGHSPGRESRVTCVPTHALELLEVAAARDAIAAMSLESRLPSSLPIDLLVQHTASMALGGGFDRDELYDEIRTTSTFANLTAEDWDWVVNFTSTGGDVLRAYPDYQKIHRKEDGRYYLEDRRLALRHRLSMGTIVNDTSLTVQYLKGAKLGTIEEAFLARLKPGDHFIFAGQPVELVFIQDSKVFVRKAKSSVDIRIPRWMGGRMPLSTELAHAMRTRLHQAANGEFRGSEMMALRPLLSLQHEWSRIPRQDELLVERLKSRDGYHLYLYPFAGRLVHEGLAAILAYRLSKQSPNTFIMAVNDYGLELLSPNPVSFEQALQDGLFEIASIQDEIAECMNSIEMARRQFREIASISGLVFNGFPGQRKSARQLQASSGLLFDVFRDQDPKNLLLRQAQSEVLERQLDLSRLVQTVNECRASKLVICNLARFSPLGFPLSVERLRERLSSEKLADRVRRMQESLERAADARQAGIRIVPETNHGGDGDSQASEKNMRRSDATRRMKPR